MFRPRATFARLTGEDLRTDDGWRWIRRPLLLCLVLGAFVSFTTSGRLALRLLVDGMIFWSFVPAMNIGAAALLAATSAGRLSFSRSTDLLFSTFGPWLCWLLGVAAVAFGPAANSLQFWWLPPTFLATLTWSSLIQVKLLRDVLDARWWRSVFLLGALKLAVWGPPLAFFALSDQLEPRLLYMLEMR